MTDTTADAPFQAPTRSAKPRSSGLTAVIDYGPDGYGWTGERGITDLLECAAEYIDFAKIYAMNALLLPAPVVKKIVKLYRDAGISCYSGGILFEYAYKKGQLAEFADHVIGLGFQTVEVSENYITLDDSERGSLIEGLQRKGLSVIYEFGRKNPETPLLLEDLEKLVLATADIGVHHVIVEQSEIDMAAAQAPETLQKVASSAWFGNILIEADPTRFPKQHVGLLEDFGIEVNLANIAPGQALRLEGFRRGIGRAVNYSLLS